MMTRERFVEVMTSNDFTDGEKFVCQAQYRRGTLSGFESALWEVMCVADSHNLERLRLGWPDHVTAVCDWRYSQLRQRFEGERASV